MGHVDPRRRHSLEKSVEPCGAAVWRGVFRTDGIAHASRHHRGGLPRGDCLGIQQGKMECRPRRSERTLLALCRLGLDVHFPDAVLVERKSEVTLETRMHANAELDKYD